MQQIRLFKQIKNYNVDFYGNIVQFNEIKQKLKLRKKTSTKTFIFILNKSKKEKCSYQKKNFQNYYFIRNFYPGILLKQLKATLNLRRNYLTNFSLLECRLDSFLVRSLIAKTYNDARQLILHKNILVNGVLIKQPSYLLKAGDIIEIHSKSLLQKRVFLSNNLKEDFLYINVPKYIEVDFVSWTGIFLYVPNVLEVPYIVSIV